MYVSKIKEDKNNIVYKVDIGLALVYTGLFLFLSTVGIILINIVTGISAGVLVILISVLTVFIVSLPLFPLYWHFIYGAVYKIEHTSFLIKKIFIRKFSDTYIKRSWKNPY